MEKIHTLLRRLKKRGYWANRVARQLEFAHSLIKAINTLDNGPYKEASSLVISHFNEEQTITKEIALKTEEVYLTTKKRQRDSPFMLSDMPTST